MPKLSAGTSQDPFVAYADCILEGGTLAWRNNNPGNLLPGKLPYKNAIGVDKRKLVHLAQITRLTFSMIRPPTRSTLFPYTAL